MKKLILFLFLLLISQICCAQIHFPDSVQTNAEKVIYLNGIAKKNSSLDSSLYYTEKAILYAKKSENDSLLYVSTYNLSFYPAIYGKFDLAIDQLSYISKLLSKKGILYFSYRKVTLLAYAYKMKGQLNTSLFHYKKAIEYAKLLKDPIFLADAYNNVGDVYQQLELKTKANKFFVLAFTLFNKLHIGENTNRRYINYKNLAMSAYNFKDAQLYSNKAIKIAKKEKNRHKMALAYLSQADAYIYLKKHKEAKKPALKAYQISDSINFEIVKNISLLQLGQSNFYLKSYRISIKYLEKAVNTIKQDNLQNHHQILEILAKGYAANRQFKKAYITSEKAVIIKDSMASLATIKEFAAFDVKFKTTQKDKEIATQQLQLAKDKNTKNKLLFGGLAALLLAYVAFQYFYTKQKQKKVAVENNLLKEQEINDLRTKFLGNIAHEIRTPLTLITGNLELAKENISNKEKAVQNIDVALSNSKKVVEDANEILDLLKFEKSKTTIKLTTVHLETTLKRIFLSFNSLALLKKLELDYQSDIQQNYQTQIDVEKVEKILNNLISNAVKYSPSNTKIIFNTSITDTILTIKVTDFGQGIHFDETEKIFQRFYQASNSQSVGGIGIGLSLAKEFATLLSGNLSVKSTLKKGSTFTFTLPITEIKTTNIDDQKEVQLINRKTATIAKNNKSTVKQLIDDTQKPHILIVEDNPEMSIYLVEILSKNYHCSTAFDGLEALEKIKTTEFDLITSDIMMPNLDGFQFRKKLNENIVFKNIPFILISAKTLPEDKIKGFQLGIDDYVVKPFHKNELIARINNLLINKKDREKWQINNNELLSNEDSSDKKLLKKIEKIVIDNVSDETFKIATLASSVGYSQRQLTRILKQYTGMSPVKFILEIRLQKAFQNLQNNTFFSLSEVRYDVGITSSSYFNKKFKERFGMNPNELLKS